MFVLEDEVLDPDPDEDNVEEETEDDDLDTEDDDEVEDNPNLDVEGDEDDADETEEEDESDTQPKVSLEDLLNNPELQEELGKRIQSEADKRFERLRRKLDSDARLQQQRARQREQQEEEDRLAEEEDWETLGRKKFEREKAIRAKQDTANEVAGLIGEAIKSRPEFVTTLADEVDSIYNSSLNETGDIVDFVVRLAEAYASAKGLDAGDAFEDRVEQEVAARLKEHGITTRSRKVKEGKSASEELSTTTTSAKPRNYKEASKLYADGKMTTEEFRPWYDKHQGRLARG